MVMAGNTSISKKLFVVFSRRTNAALGPPITAYFLLCHLLEVLLLTKTSGLQVLTMIMKSPNHTIIKLNWTTALLQKCRQRSVVRTCGLLFRKVLPATWCWTGIPV